MAGEDDKRIEKFPKKQYKVCKFDSGCKITFSAYNPDMESVKKKIKKKKKGKELLSPIDESKKHVVNDEGLEFKKSSSYQAQNQRKDLSSFNRTYQNHPANSQWILANLPISGPSPSSSNSNILQIPKANMPCSSNAGLVLSPVTSPETNFSVSPISSTTRSHLTEAFTEMQVSVPAPSHTTPIFAKLLSDGPGLSGPAEITPYEIGVITCRSQIHSGNKPIQLKPQEVQLPQVPLDPANLLSQFLFLGPK